MQILELYPAERDEQASPLRDDGVIAELNDALNIRYIAPGCQFLFERSQDELRGTTLLQFADAATHDAIAARFESLRATVGVGRIDIPESHSVIGGTLAFEGECLRNDEGHATGFYGRIFRASDETRLGTKSQERSGGFGWIREMPAALMAFDDLGRCIRASQRALDSLSLSKHTEAEALNLFKDFSLDKKQIAALQQGSDLVCDATLSSLAGADRPAPRVQLSVAALRTPDGLRFVATVVRSSDESVAATSPARDAGALYKDAFDHSQEGMYIFDPRDMRVVDMNPAFEQMLGYRRGELRNIPVYVFLNEDKDLLDAHLEIVLRTGSFATTSRQYIRKDGSILEADITANTSIAKGITHVVVFVRSVEEQRRTETVIREFEERFRQFKDRITDVIYRFNVKENSYEFISPSVELQTGYTVDELTADTADMSRRTTYADDFPMIQHRIRQHLAKGSACGPIELQYRIMRKDGSLIWVSDHKSFEFDARGTVERVNGVMRDITHQKQIEIQLRDSEEYFRTTFEASPDGVMIFDLPLEKFEINHQFTRLFGYQQFELQSSPWEVLERVPTNIIQSRLDRLEREGTLEYDAIYFTKAGTVLYCNVRFNRFYTSKGPRYCAVVRDMTDVRSLEFQLQQYSQQLEKIVAERTQELKYYSEKLEQMVEQRTEKLERANTELEQFAYTISHDLRAPLVCIEGFSELLRNETAASLTDEQREWLDIIHSSTQRMNTLIADLLELARIGRVVGQTVEVNVRDVLDDIRHEFTLTLERCNATIEYPDIFPVVRTDVQRLRQVFQNLISNAIKYNDKDAPRVTIDCEDEENVIRFSVTDNGMGIPRERLGDVFLLFKRVHATEDIEGTGAGLAIVKKIVESLGGTIGVESEVGVGTTFTFTLTK